MPVGPIYLRVKVEFLADLVGTALVDVLSVTREVCGVVDAGGTQKRAVATLEVGTVDHGRGTRPAVVTLADDRSVVAEGDGHAFVEHVQRTFPQAFVAERLAVADDAARNLVHLGETPIEHGRTEDLAANSAGAVGDDGLVFEVVVLAAVQFGMKS
jgi:hypothetical protein